MNTAVLIRLIIAIARVLNITPAQIAEAYSDADGCQQDYDEVLALLNGPVQ
jgi:hypothetical protein